MADRTGVDELTTTTPHGRARYQRGCRCADCCAANRAYARDRKRATQRAKLAALPAPAAATPEPAAGPVAAAVINQIGGTAAAQERPGLFAIAIRLAQLLDNPAAVPQHAAAAHRLTEVLERLAQSQPRRGRLSAVRDLTRPEPRG